LTLTILLRAPRISLARSRLRLRPHANEQKTGLATKLKEGGPGAADFLASIEVLIVDHADVIAMQNWQHLTTVLDAVNRIPVKRADVDVMRVRESHLEGLARHHRQTIVLSSFASPEINAMARNQCANVAGRARWRVLEYPGVLARAAAGADGARLRFDRVRDGGSAQEAPDRDRTGSRSKSASVTSVSVSRMDELRFEHFTQHTLPALRETPRPGSLVFVPSYFDFVRVRNALTAHEVSFAVASEYTPPRDAARARTLFADGRKRVLLVTERAHFYHRRKIRGVNEVHFYALPERAEFFAEFVQFANLRESASGSAGGGLVGASANRATVAFSRLDALRLERVVGTARAKKMLAPEANSAFVFTA
jgi:U3 small nucleolar RNA-associated protein 25